MGYSGLLDIKRLRKQLLGKVGTGEGALWGEELVPNRLAATRQDPGEAASFNCCKLARGSPWRGTRVGTGLRLWRSRYSSYTRTALHVDGLPEVVLILVLELLFQYPPLATAPPQRCLPSKEHLVLVPCLVKRDTGFPVKDERVEPVGLVSDEASWV